MKCYLVTYDLNKPGQDYDKIRNAIVRVCNGELISFWQSTYLIRSPLETASEVMEFLNDALDDNDKVIVFEVGLHFDAHLPTSEKDQVLRLLLKAD